MAYHGIEEAFPKAVVADPPDRGIRQRSGADSFRAEFALVSMKSAYIIDERIVFMTQLNEECSLKINCRAYKQSSIDMVVLPVRAPSSEEDVGDVVLIKLEGSSGSQAVCEGVLISKHTWFAFICIIYIKLFALMLVFSLPKHSYWSLKPLQYDNILGLFCNFTKEMYYYEMCYYANQQ